MKKTATSLLSLFLLSAFLMRTAVAQEKEQAKIETAEQKARATHEAKLPNIEAKAVQARVKAEKAERRMNALKNDSLHAAPESSVSTTDSQINKSKSKSINSAATKSAVRQEAIKTTLTSHPAK